MMGCDAATATVPNPFEPGCRGEALDTLLISAATHRVCLCDGADLGEYTDLRVLKRLTGQADVECFGVRVRPKALFVVATTTLFDLHAPEFQTPAIARRLLALRLPRQFNSMRDQAPTMMGGGRATMWLSCAVAMRLFNPVMPAPSFESTCYTLCGNAAGLAMQLVRRSNADDVCKSSSATAMLARALRTSVEELVARAALITPSLVDESVPRLRHVEPLAEGDQVAFLIAAFHSDQVGVHAPCALCVPAQILMFERTSLSSPLLSLLPASLPPRRRFHRRSQRRLPWPCVP